MEEDNIIETNEDSDQSENFYEEYDGQPDEAQEWFDFDPDC